jgi:hypothetical protein
MVRYKDKSIKAIHGRDQLAGQSGKQYIPG